MRLNKHISETGFCSRREADRLIAEGRVTINGIRGRVGSEVGEGDEVRVDGQPLRTRTVAKGQKQHVYIALTKPVGGRGIAGALTRAAFEHARVQDLHVRPACSYAAGWVDRHPEYGDLLG